MRDDRSTAAKKRRLSQRDDDEDDEEPALPTSKQEAVVKTEDKQDESKTIIVPNPTIPSRVVLLNFRGLTGKYKEWPLTEDQLARIAKYQSKLEAVKAVATNGTRLAITDDVKRDEERMLEMIDFLATGYIQPVNPTDDQTRLASLTKLISLRNLASGLEVSDMAQEISIVISKQQSLTPASFVTAAKQFCAPGAGKSISGDAVIEKWIRAYLLEHMAELDADGYIDKITEQGGKLTNILVKVLMETQQKGGRRKLRP